MYKAPIRFAYSILQPVLPEIGELVQCGAGRIWAVEAVFLINAVDGRQIQCFPVTGEMSINLVQNAGCNASYLRFVNWYNAEQAGFGQ